jgi:hypothetical protein
VHFRLTISPPVLNVNSEHNSRKVIKLMYWLSTWRLSVLNVCLKMTWPTEEIRVFAHDLQSICAENGLTE